VTAEHRSVTVHSTWRFLVSSTIGAFVVAAMGVAAIAAGGPNPVSIVLLVAGCAFVAVVAFDLPVASTFDAQGVRRHTLLRRQFLAWRAGDRLTRTRPSLVHHEDRLRQGGLVLRRGRRRYLLVDKPESEDEFAAILDVVDVAGTPGADVDVSQLPAPPSATSPTWLYRRRKWRPDGATGR
jgi:hypothetical protein